MLLKHVGSRWRLGWQIHPHPGQILHCLGVEIELLLLLLLLLAVMGVLLLLLQLAKVVSTLKHKR